MNRSSDPVRVSDALADRVRQKLISRDKPEQTSIVAACGCAKVVQCATHFSNLSPEIRRAALRLMWQNGAIQ